MSTISGWDRTLLTIVRKGYLERVACIIDQRKNEAEMQIKEMQESLENKQEEKRALENLANEYAKKIMMCKSEIRRN